MADDVRVTNWPEAGSRDRVAFDLWRSHTGYLADAGSRQEQLERSLKLFEQCRKAVIGASYDLSGLG